MNTEQGVSYKMRRKSSFSDVLLNGDDQVFVRELLMKYMPQDAQNKIVDAFNAHVDRYNARTHG